MKTTIEISDSLLQEAKRLAAKEGTSVRAYIEQGLRRIVVERKSRGLFRLRKATFKATDFSPGRKRQRGNKSVKRFTGEGADEKIALHNGSTFNSIVQFRRTLAGKQTETTQIY